MNRKDNLQSNTKYECGYSVEDSAIFNQSSLERGLFYAQFFKHYGHQSQDSVCITCAKKWSQIMDKWILGLLIEYLLNDY